MSTSSPHPVDRVVGARLRQRRLQAGLNQTELGEAMGVTFQQLQKYEQGSNRVSASKLHMAAKALCTPISWFFEPLEGDNDQDGVMGQQHDLQQFLATREGLDLAEHFPRLTGPQRRRLLGLVRTLVGPSGEEDVA